LAINVAELIVWDSNSENIASLTDGLTPKSSALMINRIFPARAVTACLDRISRNGRRQPIQNCCTKSELNSAGFPAQNYADM